LTTALRSPTLRSVNLAILIALLAATVVFFILERFGLPTTLQLHFKGDIKRETRWLAQYGQSVCTPVAALLVWRMDFSRGFGNGVKIIVAVLSTSITCMLLKRLIGRVRPGRAEAGKFLGPALRHANHRESFPSSHSACAVALSTALAMMYPSAAPVFWGLAIACAVLRYLLDAHWPSDVLGGSAIGYFIASIALVHIPI
jgi:membrane-associated phospholipid phosphatase